MPIHDLKRKKIKYCLETNEPRSKKTPRPVQPKEPPGNVF